MSPYKSLSSTSKKRPLLSDLNGMPSIWILVRAYKDDPGLAVLASSVVMLLIPVVKIMAAGLFSPHLASVTRNIQPLFDTSLLTNLESTYSSSDADSQVQNASQFAEWAMIPSFQVPRRSGILENLVFSDLIDLNLNTQAIDLAGSQIHVNAPAIAVDVKCVNVPMTTSMVQLDTIDEEWSFEFSCTGACEHDLE
ncbi:MAG: hypothetical protein Q9160_006004 [Pyrenula sp. 1 TL-2023]